MKGFCQCKPKPAIAIDIQACHSQSWKQSLLVTITVGHLGSEDDTDGESDEKDKDVQPEESVRFEIVYSIQLIKEMIIWIVAWEHNSPRAHEEV